MNSNDIGTTIKNRIAIESFDINNQVKLCEWNFSNNTK